MFTDVMSNTLIPWWTRLPVSDAVKFNMADRVYPLTYTYLDCLLGVKMRGRKMAEIWEWLLMGSTADHAGSKSACRRFVLFWYTALCRVFRFVKTKYNYARPKFPYFTVVSLYSCIRIISISTGRCSLFRFSTTISLLASYCKWFYWTKVH